MATMKQIVQSKMKKWNSIWWPKRSEVTAEEHKRRKRLQYKLAKIETWGKARKQRVYKRK